MIGRHHARLLQTAPTLEFAGAVDPGGDRIGAVQDHSRLYASTAELIEAAKPDFAVVAVPTEEHLPAVRELAAAGVHVLVEKPLAATAADARELIAVCEQAGVRGAVGHVERSNPALMALREHLNSGEIGDPFLIATERVGPFPDRIRDVGVVKDLATHDLDLVRWIGGSAVARVAAEVQRKAGREHEDLVLATGRLRNETTFNCVVDWLTPAKVRRTRVLGSEGMLVADTLTADLTLYRNGTTVTDYLQQFRGVSEGDMTRFALERREPLLVQLEAFAAYAAGDLAAPVVTLQEGLETVEVAEAVLRSAADGETVTL
jgi:predicted dehydrogenase